MANFSSSPGVKLNEIDNSFITPIPVSAGAAIIGPTVKGPVELPTVVTSYSDFKDKFGGSFTSGSNIFSYLTSISAYNYFTEGGDSLLVARVVSGTYTAASSSATVATSTSASIVFETLSKGTIMNTGTDFDGDGILTNGTIDNIKFEIAGSNIDTGTFNVLVRQGNDKNSDKIVLETFNKVSLDPNQSNFISKVIGDQVVTYDSETNQIDITSGEFANISRYIRVKSIPNLTTDYFDNAGVAKTTLKEHIPVNGTGSFGGALGDVIAGANFYKDISAGGDLNTQGLVGTDYDNMISLLGNINDYQFNVLSTPGLNNGSHTLQISSIINNTIERGDNIFVMDTIRYASTLANALTQAATRNTSYAATYFPWLRVQDPETGKIVFVPPPLLIQAGAFQVLATLSL